MSSEPPTPPVELPTDIVNTLNGYAPDQLQHVARYAKELTEHKVQKSVSTRSRRTTKSMRDRTIFRTTSRRSHDHDQGNQ